MHSLNFLFFATLVLNAVFDSAGNRALAALPAEIDPLQLESMVGQATHVGLGEQVHGSGKMTEMKAEVVKFLVERMGFRALAFESPFGTALGASRFVSDCSGSAVGALQSLTAVAYQDSSLLDLLEWLCTYNKSHPDDKVSLFGYDIQSSFYANYYGLVLKNALRKLGHSTTSVISRGLESCKGVRYEDVPKGAHKICESSLQEIQKVFSLVSDPSRLNGLTPEELAWAQISLTSLKYSEAEITSPTPAQEFGQRDQGSFEVFELIQNLKFPNKKTILWAANVHLASRHDKFQPSSYFGYGAKSTGTHLKEKLGDSYFAIFFIGYKVGVRTSSDFAPTGALPLPNTSSYIEYLAHQYGKSYLLIDTRKSFLSRQTPYRMSDVVSWGDNRASYIEFYPHEQCDAIFYIDQARENDLP